MTGDTSEQNHRTAIDMLTLNHVLREPKVRHSMNPIRTIVLACRLIKTWLCSGSEIIKEQKILTQASKARCRRSEASFCRKVIFGNNWNLPFWPFHCQAVLTTSCKLSYWFLYRLCGVKKWNRVKKVNPKTFKNQFRKDLHSDSFGTEHYRLTPLHCLM